VRSGLLANETPEYLLSLGVPKSFVDLVRTVDEDGLLELLSHLPEEAQEELAAGNRPVPASVPEINRTADPFVHPDAQRRFWVVSDQEMLAHALDRPWAEWLVFLHPSQRAAVERSFNGAARVSGSAGTGKSVVAMHRAAHLAQTSEAARVLLTTFSRTLAGTLSDGMDTLLGVDSGAETGIFEVPAGGRRYRALQLLVKQKRLAKNAPVPCVVRDPSTAILTEDDSLAENIQRVGLPRSTMSARNRSCAKSSLSIPCVKASSEVHSTHTVPLSIFTMRAFIRSSGS
jgi:AAA domain